MFFSVITPHTDWQSYVVICELYLCVYFLYVAWRVQYFGIIDRVEYLGPNLKLKENFIYSICFGVSFFINFYFTREYFGLCYQ